MGEDLTLDELDERINAMILEVAEKAKAEQRAESAELIRGELVCPCGSFEKMEAIPFVDGKPDRAAMSARHRAIDHHDICFFGEWAAVIVEKGPKR